MAVTKMDINLKKCVTPEFRVSFPAVFEAKSFKGQEAQFSVVMLFDKKTDLKELRKIALNAAEEKWGSDQKKWPKDFRRPFRDGDVEKPDTIGYPGTVFVSAKSKTQPGLVGPSRQPILNAKDFYAGCYARAEVIAFAYDNIGNGVSFSLQNIQKLRDGDSLSGRKNAEDVFDAVTDSSEDAASYASGDDMGIGM